MPVGHFLGGIAALIWDEATDCYLLLRRAAHKDVGAGHWECVTGRVDQGESYEEALHREVREEIGVPAQIQFIIGTTHFYRGPVCPENELLGVFYACAIADPTAVTFSPEHDQMRWIPAPDIPTFLPDAHWLRPVIARAELIRQHFPEELRRAFRHNEF